MANPIDLKALEHKAWTTYFQDGLWDLFFGIMVLSMGLRGLTDNPVFTMGVMLALVVAIFGKRYITIPRIGVVKFGPARKAKQRRIAAALIISLLVLVGFLLPEYWLPLAVVPLSPLIALWLAVFFAILAHALEFPRLYLYGLLFAGSEFVWGVYGLPFGPLAHVLSGTLIIVIGIGVLLRFLHQYPQVTGYETD
ncbi:MAG: hypothetical protein KKA90_02205 [Nanoarchaeota archaeon]|nr:hypothetical protein [Nanoarchaeota archaeon]